MGTWRLLDCWAWSGRLSLGVVKDLQLSEHRLCHTSKEVYDNKFTSGVMYQAWDLKN